MSEILWCKMHRHMLHFDCDLVTYQCELQMRSLCCCSSIHFIQICRMNGFTSCCILLSANTEASTCLCFHTRGSRCSIFLRHHLVFLSRNWCNRGSNNYMSIFSMFFLTCTISHVLTINRDYCMLPFLFQPGRYNIFICYNFFLQYEFFLLRLKYHDCDEFNYKFECFFFVFEHSLFDFIKHFQQTTI